MKGISSWLSADVQCHIHCDLGKKKIQVQYHYSDFAASFAVQTVWWDKKKKLCGVCLKTHVVNGKIEAFKEGRRDPT